MTGERTPAENTGDAREIRSVTFSDTVMECWRTPELMAEYRKLTGSTLGLDNRCGLTRAIDEACGHDPWESEYAPFFEFVRDCVWLPLAADELARISALSADSASQSTPGPAGGGSVGDG